MRILLAATAALALNTLVQAQEFAPTASLGVDVRVDYQQLCLDGDVDDAGSGFKGRYLNVLLSGELSPKLSYNIRQRLNKAVSDATFMDATDWAYISYKPSERWTISAGKLVVAVGSCEYDKASIDIYRGSEFWHNIPCYQMGVSGAYNFKNGNDQLLAQISESPFRTKENNNLYAYNLLWYGNHGVWSTFYSANLMATDRDRYIGYLVLGNKIQAGRTTMELDFINRAASHQAFFLKDCSAMAEFGVQVSTPWRLFTKVTYDVNHSGTDADQLVWSGTEVTQVGIGVEYKAFKRARNDVRLHACYFRSWGTNANPDGTMQDKMSLFNMGLKWHVDMFSTHRK